jgi:hypothetical protein
MNPIIHLTPWEYERCFAVGSGRFTANWDTPDAAHYDRSLMEPDRNAQVAAAACELAVAKFTNQYWHASVWHRSDHGKYRGLADVGSDIEVRRVRTGNAVKVRKKDAGKVVWAARVADDEYRSVEILGFISADEVIKSLAGTYESDKYVEIECLERPW